MNIIRLVLLEWMESVLMSTKHAVLLKKHDDSYAAYYLKIMLVIV